MISKLKQIVLDKNVFAFTKEEALCALAKSYALLLSDALLYECATAKKQNPQTLFCRYERLIKAGAHYCSMHRSFLEWEGWHCVPYLESLADAQLTNRLRHGDIRIDSILTSKLPDYLNAVHTRRADALLAEFSRHMKRKVDSHIEDLASQINRIPNPRSRRLGEWLRRIDQMDIYAMGVESLPAGWIRVSGEFCLSFAWMTWQYVRLVAALEYEYWYVRQTGGPRDKWAEHDLEDAEYALLLSRADAIITRDKGLAELIRAAFPGKKAFSSLKDVPGDWANR